MSLEQKLLDRRKVYADVFENSESGRKVLDDLKAYTGAKAVSHVPGDPHSTAYNEGKRSVYLHIQTILDMEPNDIRKMLQEQDN